jgi:hypothetical protein
MGISKLPITVCVIVKVQVVLVPSRSETGFQLVPIKWPPIQRVASILPDGMRSSVNAGGIIIPHNGNVTSERPTHTTKKCDWDEGNQPHYA